MKDLRDKVAAITGASSGIGRALAIELARRKCHLALSDVNEQGLLLTSQLAKAYGVRVTVDQVDVADRPAMLAWSASAAARHGRINLIFNNAGVALAANAEDATPQDFEWLMGINFWGVVNGTQAFMPYLRASGDGHVVNVSSLFGLMALPGQAAYNASKFAVRGYTEALRMELESADACVSATCVHPGGIATNIASSSRIDEAYLRRSGVSEEKHRRAANRMIQTTSPESAALQIIDAVQRDARRVVVGWDARTLDKLIRVLGPRYQALAVRWTRRRADKKQDAAQVQ